MWFMSQTDINRTSAKYDLSYVGSFEGFWKFWANFWSVKAPKRIRTSAKRNIISQNILPISGQYFVSFGGMSFFKYASQMVVLISREMSRMSTEIVLHLPGRNMKIARHRKTYRLFNTCGTYTSANLSGRVCVQFVDVALNTRRYIVRNSKAYSVVLVKAMKCYGSHRVSGSIWVFPMSTDKIFMVTGLIKLGSFKSRVLYCLRNC